MADNVATNPGNGGATIAADDIAGVMHQRVKIQHGADGVATDVSGADPLPVSAAGDVAHDAADSGNPVKLGAKAANAEPTAVANADRVNLIADLVGKLITLPYTMPEKMVSGHATNTDGAETSCIVAGGAGVRTYMTTIVLANSSSTDGTVAINDGTGSTKMTIPVPANGGAPVTLPTPLRGTANTAWLFDPSAAMDTITCTMVGYQGV